jgi:hypothetical protein
LVFAGRSAPALLDRNLSRRRRFMASAERPSATAARNDTQVTTTVNPRFARGAMTGGAN